MSSSQGIAEALRALGMPITIAAADRIEEQRATLGGLSRALIKANARADAAEAAIRDMRRQIDAMRTQIAALRSGPEKKT